MVSIVFIWWREGVGAYCKIWSRITSKHCVQITFFCECVCVHRAIDLYISHLIAAARHSTDSPPKRTRHDALDLLCGCCQPKPRTPFYYIRHLRSILLARARISRGPAHSECARIRIILFSSIIIIVAVRIANVHAWHALAASDWRALACVRVKAAPRAHSHSTHTHDHGARSIGGRSLAHWTRTHLNLTRRKMYL